MLLDGYALARDLGETMGEFAVVTDDVGREYRSTEGVMGKALEKFRQPKAG